MKTISLKLPEGLDHRLETSAKGLGTSKSDLIRSAIEVYFAAAEPGYAGSCLALMGDLVGTLEGPRDLSSNKKYMAGFGK